MMGSFSLATVVAGGFVMFLPGLRLAAFMTKGTEVQTRTFCSPLQMGKIKPFLCFSYFSYGVYPAQLIQGKADSGPRGISRADCGEECTTLYTGRHVQLDWQDWGESCKT